MPAVLPLSRRVMRPRDERHAKSARREVFPLFPKKDSIFLYNIKTSKTDCTLLLIIDLHKCIVKLKYASVQLNMVL